MRCGLVLTAALAAVACCLSSTRPRADTSPPADTCSAVTRDLKSQIETIKQQKAHPDNGFATFSKKHGKPEDPQKTLSRAREQAEALNALLPGMGCPRLDIDSELAQPANQALLPAPPKSSKKHRTLSQ